MSRQKEFIAHLLDAFPPKPFYGEVVSHDCPECPEIRATLGGATWWSVPGHFIQQHAHHLSVLTPDAYKAFLSAWLCEAVANPTGEVADAVIESLRQGVFASHFSQQESYAVIQVAKWIAENNGRGANDPANRASVSDITRVWGEHGD